MMSYLPNIIIPMLIIKPKGMIDDVVQLIHVASVFSIILTKSTSSIIARCMTSLEHDFQITYNTTYPAKETVQVIRCGSFNAPSLGDFMAAVVVLKALYVYLQSQLFVSSDTGKVKSYGVTHQAGIDLRCNRLKIRHVTTDLAKLPSKMWEHSRPIPIWHGRGLFPRPSF